MPWIWGGPCHNFEWEASTSATCNVKLICDSRSFGELYFQHWNFQLPCFKGKIICEIWMKTKHLIIHIHLKYEVGNPLSGCWAWQFLDQLYDPRKIQAEFDPTKELTHTGQYHLLSLMWFCIIWSYLSAFSPRKPRLRPSKSQPLVNRQSAWITTWFWSPPKITTWKITTCKCLVILGASYPKQLQQNRMNEIKVSYQRPLPTSHFFIHQLWSLHPPFIRLIRKILLWLLGQHRLKISRSWMGFNLEHPSVEGK